MSDLPESVINFLFGLGFLVVSAILVVALLFVALAVHTVWKWFAGEANSRANIKADRKAFRG